MEVKDVPQYVFDTIESDIKRLHRKIKESDRALPISLYKQDLKTAQRYRQCMLNLHPELKSK